MGERSAATFGSHASSTSHSPLLLRVHSAAMWRPPMPCSTGAIVNRSLQSLEGERASPGCLAVRGADDRSLAAEPAPSGGSRREQCAGGSAGRVVRRHGRARRLRPQSLGREKLEPECEGGLGAPPPGAHEGAAGEMLERPRSTAAAGRSGGESRRRNGERAIALTSTLARTEPALRARNCVPLKTFGRLPESASGTWRS